jgi:hypothetical protein
MNHYRWVHRMPHTAPGLQPVGMTLLEMPIGDGVYGDVSAGGGSAVMPRQTSTSCGVIVTDGERILLGHGTRSPRWDIPKGSRNRGKILPRRQRGTSAEGRS